jgi:hypothetical protein
MNTPKKIGSWQAFLSFNVTDKNNVRISFPMQTYKLNTKQHCHLYNKSENLYGTYLHFTW